MTVCEANDLRGREEKRPSALIMIKKSRYKWAQEHAVYEEFLYVNKSHAADSLSNAKFFADVSR